MTKDSRDALLDFNMLALAFESTHDKLLAARRELEQAQAKQAAAEQEIRALKAAAVRMGCIDNTAVGKAPAEPTIQENTLLFLPACAVQELGLTPNMDDKGDPQKSLWFGRVWQLRALIAAKHKQKLDKVAGAHAELTQQAKDSLSALLKDEVVRARLVRLQARWKGIQFRMRSTLCVLRHLKFCNFRGTLIYCHGSGGCSWDNMRICRMISRLGVVVIAPDGFAYPKNTAMGQMRHKDIRPIPQHQDDVDYWAGDLIYCSDASGTSTYSTKADKVLENPKDFCELYERCYQLRRSELHMTIRGLPRFIKSKGFFLGGTSEGAMTIARFDDQRYGESVCGRFINSFSIEYNYFTPTKHAGEIGGQLDVPTLNIIGTKDQYFGPEDSVAKIVASDARGYGDQGLVGHGYKTLVRQHVEVGLVCVLEDGVHSPCDTHDNFLRMLFDVFFSRPGSIWELDAIWNEDPSMRGIVEVQQSCVLERTPANVVQVFVPKDKYPNKWSLRQVELHRQVATLQTRRHMEQQLKVEAEELRRKHAEVKSMLDGIRAVADQRRPDDAKLKEAHEKSQIASLYHQPVVTRKREKVSAHSLLDDVY